MDNKLNIQITVDDEQMASLIKGNLESLPEEKIQEIFSSALTEFLNTNDGQKLFYTRQYYSSEPQPTRLLTQMVENAVSKDLLKPCVDEFVNVIKDNYESLIKNCIIETFSNMFFTEMKSVVLKSELNTMLYNGLNNK